MVKASAYNVGNPSSIPGSGRSHGEGNGNSLQYSCLEKSHGQRSLVGYSPWGRKVLDILSNFTFTFTFSSPLEYIYMGEGNGTPLKYSCLENPMDGEAW